MINKGLDTTFIHFGIRKDDMEIIKNLFKNLKPLQDFKKEN